MFMLRRFTSVAMLSSGADDTCARMAAGRGASSTGPPGFAHRMPARSSAAAQPETRSCAGSCATALSPALLRSMPIVPRSVHPPSGSARSESRRPRPPTVVAAIRTMRLTPSG